MAFTFASDLWGSCFLNVVLIPFFCLNIQNIPTYKFAMLNLLLDMEFQNSNNVRFLLKQSLDKIDFFHKKGQCSHVQIRKCRFFVSF